MASDPFDTDPADRDPRENRLRRGSDAPANSVWLIVGGILLLGVVVYVASALL
jgi:hypothetical protein